MLVDQDCNKAVVPEHLHDAAKALVVSGDYDGAIRSWRLDGSEGPLQQPAAHHHMLVQRDGAALGHDDLDPATHLGEPVAELLSVADRRGQGDQLH